MNALANSQIKEIDKFLDQAGLPPELRPKVARYTGQESQEEREQIRKDKPDILLTNFMMLELLMTRQSELDRQVIENAQGLEFIVLDELHTYRGRQGADVAVLVRRLRDRCCPECAADLHRHFGDHGERGFEDAARGVPSPRSPHGSLAPPLARMPYRRDPRAGDGPGAEACDYRRRRCPRRCRGRSLRA